MPGNTQTHNSAGFLNTLASFATTMRRRLGFTPKDRWETLSADVSLKPAHEIRSVFKDGARKFGLWDLSENTIAPLLDFTLSRRLWPIIDEDEDKIIGEESGSAAGVRRTRRKTNILRLFDCRLVVIGILIDAISIAYGIYAGITSGAYGLVGWPVIIARASGLATLLYTDVLIFSMTKHAFSFLYVRFPTALRTLTYIKLHRFACVRLTIYSIVHTATHLARTVPKLLAHGKDEWNAVIRCASLRFRPVNFLEFPACPLQVDLTLSSVLCSTVVISGFSLIAVLGLFGLSGLRALRDFSFGLFKCVHNILLFVWIFGLYLHGASQFFGMGIPLVLPVCLPFILAYVVDKCVTYSGSISRVDFDTDKVFTVTIVLDKKRLPSYADKGTFVLICIPEISCFQYHPFSVVRATDAEMQLTISVRGTWTRNVMALIKRKSEIGGRIADLHCRFAGPFVSPVFSMTSIHADGVVVIVAAGVGITPFLGSLDSVIRKASVVFLFWTVREGVEVLHAHETLAGVCADRKFHVKIFITKKVAVRKDDAAFLFFETITKCGGSLKVNLPYLTDPQIELQLGRPLWIDEFSAIRQQGFRWVFVCANRTVTCDVGNACDECFEKHGNPFALTAEEF